MDILSVNDFTVFFQLALATLLGMGLGVERSIAGKTAGMRTYALVSLGSCLFTVTSVLVSTAYMGVVDFDPLRIAAGIVTGIGFIGAGVIIFRENTPRGLTTAAGLWVVSGIGIAVGFGLYGLAVFTTLLALSVFTLMWYLENRVKHFSEYLSGHDGEASE